MRTNATKATNMIKLDVGGKIFKTCKENLISCEESYFYTMLSSGQWQPDGDGAYCIDRDPTHFPRIIEWLRSHDDVCYKDMAEAELTQLHKELDYYQLPFPRSWWTSRRKTWF